MTKSDLFLSVALNTGIKEQRPSNEIPPYRQKECLFTNDSAILFMCEWVSRVKFVAFILELSTCHQRKKMCNFTLEFDGH